MTLPTTPSAFRSVLSAIVGLAFFSAWVQSAIGATATVNSTGSQTVKGWGSFPSYCRTDWGTIYDVFNRPAIQDAIYTIGQTHFRVDVQPRLYVSGSTLSDIVLSESALNDLVRQINIGRSHGIDQYIMSCWSPPAVWKLPQQTIDGQVRIKGQTVPTYLDPTKNANYVAYYTKVLQTLQARGVGLPVAISIQNEPDIYPTYDGCYYDIWNSDPARANQWKDVVKLMRASFDGNGLASVMIHGPECSAVDNDANFLGGDGFPVLNTDSELNAILSNFAIHSYGTNWWTGTQNGMNAHPRDSWVTEWSIYDGRFGSTEIDWTLGSMRHFASNFVDLPNNYWFWWLQWYHGTGAPGSGTLLSGDQTPIYSKRYHIFQRLWTTVKPGWVVHKMTCDDPNFVTSNSQNFIGDTLVNLVSFRDPTGTRSVTLLINHTSGAVDMTVNGLVGSGQTTYLSDATRDMVRTSSGPVSGGSATVNLPAKSVSLLITPSTPTSAPPAPAGLAATPGDGQVSLSWTASPGATTYNVKRGTTSGGPYTQILRVSATRAMEMGLTNGSSYYYVVSAVNENGESGNSAEAAGTPQTAPPPAPTGLTAVTTSNVALSWNASPGATSYNVKRSTSDGGPYSTVSSPTTTSYADNDVTAGTTYYYVVSAVNAAGQSPNSSQVSGTPTAPTGPPAAPSNLSGTALSCCQVSLNWTDNSNDETGFYLERQRYSDGWIQIATPGANVTGYVDNGVTYGQTYYYRIRAYNGIGTSAYSNQITVKTPHR